MKRFFAFAGLMTAAAISLTNCQPKEIGLDQVPSANKTIYITAGTAADTKTTNDGMHTFWEAADTMNVFCKASGDYVNLGKAKVAEGAGTSSATFEITVPDGSSLPSGAATWYAFFPYQKKMVSPDGTTGYTYLGHSKGVTQDGFGSKAHLCGNVCPMYGVAEGNGSTVSLTMKQLASVIEFNVKNSTGKEIIVKSITVTASEDIVGTYYFNFSGNDVVYTPSGELYVYKSATVNLEDSTLGAGESGKVYLPIKPYTQTGVFKVVVNCTVGGNDATANFELNPTGSKAVFQAGKIKPVALDITTLDTGGNTVAEAQAEAGSYTLKNVQVTSIVTRNVFVTDATGTILVYTTADTASGLAVGDYVDVTGNTKAYNNLMEFDSPTITKVSSGSVNMSATTWSDTQMAGAYNNAQVAYVTYQATFTAARNATIPGSEAILYTTNASGVSITADKVYKVTGYVYGWTDYKKNDTVTKEVCMYVETAEEVGSGPQVEESSVVFDFNEGLDAMGLSAPAAGEPGLAVDSFTQDGVTVTVYNSNNGTPARIYLGTGTDPKTSFRTYKGNAVVISAPAGKNITKVSGIGSSESSLGDGEKSSVVTLVCTGGATVNKLTVSLDTDTVVPGIGGARTKVSATASSGNTVNLVLGGFASAPSLSATPDGTVVTSASVSGSTVTYAVSANLGSEDREGTITVKSGDYSATVTVYQVKADFNVSRDEIYLDAKAGVSTTFTVKSDQDWSAALSGSGFTVSPDSFSYDGENKSVTVSVSADANNASADQIELGSFVINRTDGVSSKVIKVYQKSAKLATPEITLTPDGANGKITASWKAVPGASEYNYAIEENGVSMGPPETTNELSVEITGLTAGKTYKVYVMAIGDGNPYMDSAQGVAEIELSASSSSETIDFSTKGYSNAELVESVSGSSFTVSFNKGTASNDPKYFTTGTAIRVYGGGTFTVSSSKTIKSIDLTFGSGDGSNEITVNTGSYAANTWSGSSNSVVFSVGGTSGHRRIKAIKVVF